MEESQIEGNQRTRLSSGGHVLVDFCGGLLFGLWEWCPVRVCGWGCRGGVVDAHVATLMDKCRFE